MAHIVFINSSLDTCPSLHNSNTSFWIVPFFRKTSFSQLSKSGKTLSIIQARFLSCKTDHARLQMEGLRVSLTSRYCILASLELSSFLRVRMNLSCFSIDTSSCSLSAFNTLVSFLRLSFSASNPLA